MVRILAPTYHRQKRPPAFVATDIARAALALTLLATALAVLPAPIAAAAPLPRGTAVWWGCMEERFQGPASLACPRAYDPRYERTVLERFDRITPENELKMAHLQPRQGAFDFRTADRVAGFARANAREIRGHALVWGADLPRWITDARVLDWGREEALDVMRTHIRTVVRHFATRFPGVVSEWDVVNEPLDESGRLARTFWATRIGRDYVERALREARAADPSAKLVVNEVGVEHPGPKSDALLALVRDLKQRGVPLDAVGWQMHLGSPPGAPPVDDLVALMRRYAELGVEVEVTELDVPTPTLASTLGGNPVLDQADAYRRVALACRRAGNCSGLTVWGVADPYSWRGEDARALMFDASFQPKPQVADIDEILGAAPSRGPRVVAGRTRMKSARHCARPARRSRGAKRDRRARRARRCAPRP